MIAEEVVMGIEKEKGKKRTINKKEEDKRREARIKNLDGRKAGAIEMRV